MPMPRCNHQTDCPIRARKNSWKVVFNVWLCCSGTKRLCKSFSSTGEELSQWKSDNPHDNGQNCRNNLLETAAQIHWLKETYKIVSVLAWQCTALALRAPLRVRSCHFEAKRICLRNFLVFVLGLRNQLQDSAHSNSLSFITQREPSHT